MGATGHGKAVAADARGRSLEFAWRAYGAVQDSIKAADQKASIILVLSAAVATLAGRETFASTGGLHAASGGKLWLVRAMASTLAAAAMFATAVVFPRMRRFSLSGGGLVYFGHLRRRSTDNIKAHLVRLDDDEALTQLADQLRVVSRIAWRKHAYLQGAILCLVLATALFGLARLAL
jgi:hypothetical protein